MYPINFPSSSTFLGAHPLAPRRPLAGPGAAPGASSNASPTQTAAFSDYRTKMRAEHFHRTVIKPYAVAAPGKPMINAGFEAAFRKEDFKVLPRQIHMVWVGSKPGEAQLKYAKNWAEKNPGAVINIWLDSRQLGAYEENKKVGQQLEQIFPDKNAYQNEKLFRGLFNQLHASLSQVGPEHELARKQALSELNKELVKLPHLALKRRLVPVGNVTADNAPAIRLAYHTLTKGNDEKFRLAERLILSQTIKAWESAALSKEPVGQANATLHAMQNQLDALVVSGNIKVRDLSDPKDLPVFKNRMAYQHGIVGRNGAYPEASDVARYEILHHVGGTYTDIDLECTKPLGDIGAHPDLMLVGLAEGKGEASGGKTPYFANALLSSHPGSKTVGNMIEAIGAIHANLKGNTYSGSRYFDRPNKSTIETTGPNGLREQIDNTIRSANGHPIGARANAESRALRVWSQDRQENAAFWSAVRSHMAFPEGFVNFETEEQQQSATKDMA